MSRPLPFCSLCLEWPSAAEPNGLCLIWLNRSSSPGDPAPVAPLTPPQLILVAYSFCLLLPPAVNKEVLVTTVSLAPKTVPSMERALKKHRRLHECPVCWLEPEQRRATRWRCTKALASSPYDSLFLRQPWTCDSSTIPACQSEQPGREAATTCPRTHSRRKSGHGSTWGGGVPGPHRGP